MPPTGLASPQIAADGLATTLNDATLLTPTSATLASAASFTPGTVVIISAGTATAELALVTAVAGNVVTFADLLQVAHSVGAAIARVVVNWLPAAERPGVSRS